MERIWSGLGTAYATMVLLFISSMSLDGLRLLRVLWSGSMLKSDFRILFNWAGCNGE